MSTTRQHHVRLRTILAAMAVAAALPLGVANAEAEAEAEAEPPASTPDTSFGPKTTFVEWEGTPPGHRDLIGHYDPRLGHNDWS